MTTTCLCLKPNGDFQHLICTPAAHRAELPIQVCRAVECNMLTAWEWCERAFHWCMEAGWNKKRGLTKALQREKLYELKQAVKSEVDSCGKGFKLEFIYNYLHDKTIPSIEKQLQCKEEKRVAARWALKRQKLCRGA